MQQRTHPVPPRSTKLAAGTASLPLTGLRTPGVGRGRKQGALHLHAHAGAHDDQRLALVRHLQPRVARRGLGAVGVAVLLGAAQRLAPAGQPPRRQLQLLLRHGKALPPARAQPTQAGTPGGAALVPADGSAAAGTP